jgi:hypothetical protein
MKAGGAVHVLVIPITTAVLLRLRRVRASIEEQQQQVEEQTQQKTHERMLEKQQQHALQQEKQQQLQLLEHLREGEKEKSVVCIEGNTLGERIQTLIDNPTLQQQWNNEFYERRSSPAVRNVTKLLNKLFWGIRTRYNPGESATGGGGLSRPQLYEVRCHCKIGLL